MKFEKGDLLSAVAMVIMIAIIVIAYTGISFVTPTFSLTSTAFTNNGTIPTLYSCDGEGKSPPLTFANVPTHTKSIVLIVQDLDAPKKSFVHWLLYGIDPATKDIKEAAAPEGSVEGYNSTTKTGYIPFCPDEGTHRYLFTAYASDHTYRFVKTPTVDELKRVMKWQVLGKAELEGKYTRQPKA